MIGLNNPGASLRTNMLSRWKLSPVLTSFFEVIAPSFFL